jgi:hypothetical protein
MEPDTPAPLVDANLLNQTLVALQAQIMQMQERHDDMFKVLTDYGMIRSPIPGNMTGLRDSPTQSEHRTNVAPSKHTGPKPATPNDFDGERTKGRSFLNSVKWYLRSRGHEFRNLDHMVSWTLSFMKEGRALTFANQITRQVDKQGILPYTTWSEFWAELEKRFLPIDESEEAINVLETDRYFQGKQTVDDYCDRFQDLVDHAGYLGGRQVVMKFRKGLESEIADRVALLQEKRPQDDDLDGWIEMAKEVARQRVRNEAFNQAVRKDRTTVKAVPAMTFKPGTFLRTSPAPMKQNTLPVFNRSALPVKATTSIFPAPAPPKATDSGPVPMEVDASRSKGKVPVVCHRCGQPGHFRSHCPRQYDVRFMSTEELEECLQNQLVQKDVTATVAMTEIEEGTGYEGREDEQVEGGFQVDHE